MQKEIIKNLLKRYNWIIKLFIAGIVGVLVNSIAISFKVPDKVINSILVTFCIITMTLSVTLFNAHKERILSRQELDDEKLVSLSENSYQSFYQLQIALKYLDKHSENVSLEINEENKLEKKKEFISNNKDCFRMICLDFNSFLETFDLRNKEVRYHINFLTQNIKIVDGGIKSDIKKYHYYSFFDDEMTFQERIRTNLDSTYDSYKITSHMKKMIKSIINGENPNVSVVRKNSTGSLVVPIYSMPSKNIIYIFGFFEILFSEKSCLLLDDIKNLETIIQNKALEKASVFGYYIEAWANQMLIINNIKDKSGIENYDLLADITRTLEVR